MSTEAVIAIVVFVAMFAAWAIVPSFLKKRHTSKGGKETATE